MVRWVFLLSATAFVYLAAVKWEQRPISHPAGVLVAQPPRQTTAGDSVVRHGDFILTRRARFRFEARVLSTERYFWGKGSRLSPIDLVLGWGPMSDQAVLDRISISQNNRWYFTRYDLPPPISEEQIIAHSANMHMVPASSQLNKSLKKLRAGDVVQIQGFLVDADHPSGWNWRTSMSREDTGAGACEIVLVEELSVQQPPKMHP